VKAIRRKPGSTWHFDEMFITLRGAPYLLWRAVDEHGLELDILVQKRRNKAAAKRFFKRVLHSNPVPRKIVTDQLRSYPTAKAEIPELANVKHVFVKAAARLNNRAENSHQPTRERERRMRGFGDPKRTQKFSLVLRADPSTFRAQATSAARFTLSQTTCCPLCRLEQIHRDRSKSVVRFLISRHACRRAVPISVS
jgi:putative transposase